MKLYLIVASALSAGLRIPQAVHAFASFTKEHPAKVADWEADNNLVVLQHEDLPGLAARLEARGLALSRFHEPDLQGQLTALCVEPKGKRHLRTLQLA